MNILNLAVPTSTAIVPAKSTPIVQLESTECKNLLDECLSKSKTISKDRCYRYQCNFKISNC